MSSKLHYQYIDALRGYAILMVIAVHTSQAATGIEGPLRNLLNDGARGVQLFFVASALTLAMSWKSRNDGALNFYVRRLFRIAPMFWLAICGFTALMGTGPSFWAPHGIGPRHIILTTLFMHGWQPDTFNSVVPGGWSIAAEMTFYLIFPVLIFLICGWASALFATVAGLWFSKSVYALLWDHHLALWPGSGDIVVSSFITSSILFQLPVFLIGFLVYFLNRDLNIKIPLFILNLALVAAIISLIALSASPVVLTFMNSLATKVGATETWWRVNAFGILFGIITFSLARGGGTFLVNRPARFIGKISFSAYLWQFAVLLALPHLPFDPFFMFSGPKSALFFLALYPVVVAVTAFFSWVTYTYVEQPGVKLGNRILQRTSRSTVELRSSAALSADQQQS